MLEHKHIGHWSATLIADLIYARRDECLALQLALQLAADYCRGTVAGLNRD